MPVTIHCPHCNARCTMPDHLAGRAVACPRCKQPITLPASPRQPDQLDFGSESLSTRSAQQGHGREPWFIPFAEVFALVVMWVGLVTAGVAFLMTAVAAGREDEPGLLLAAVLWFLLHAAGILFATSLLLIFVDMARSLRSLVAGQKAP